MTWTRDVIIGGWTMVVTVIQVEPQAVKTAIQIQLFTFIPSFLTTTIPHLIHTNPMVGTKRAADAEGPSARSSKVAKTNASPASKSKKGAKKGGKAALPAGQFKAKALPLHVNISHTPPSLPKDDMDEAVPSDAGFIGNLTLVPNSFSTGSYGWKGSKRITVELQDSEGSEKEKVQVMLTINATVMGSKQAAGEDDAEEAKDTETKDEEAKDEEPSEDMKDE